MAAKEYLRFPAGVDSTLFIAAPGFSMCDFLGNEADRATSLDFALATEVDKINEMNKWTNSK